VDLSFIHFFFHSLTLLLTRHIFPDNLFYLSSFHDITFFFHCLFVFFTHLHTLPHLFISFFHSFLFVCLFTRTTDSSGSESEDESEQNPHTFSSEIKKKMGQGPPGGRPPPPSGTAAAERLAKRKEKLRQLAQGLK